MKNLKCSACGRLVGAGHTARNGNTCGAWLVLRKAEIRKVGGRVVFLNQVSSRCAGILLLKRYRAK